MELKEYVQKFKLYLFDMDGTLYLGDRLYDFTNELLDTIKKTGGTYLFMTNNSSKSVNDYVKKLKKLGIEATRDDFMTSSQATAYYLHKHHEGKKLYASWFDPASGVYSPLGEIAAKEQSFKPIQKYSNGNDWVLRIDIR